MTRRHVAFAHVRAAFFAAAGAAAATIAVCVFALLTALPSPSGNEPVTGRAPSALSRHPSAAVPPAARGRVARAIGGSDRRFFIRHSQSGFVVLDRPAGVIARFGRGRATVRTGGVWWPVGLRAIGRGDRLARTPRTWPSAHANKLWYARPGVTEWYADGPLGLEQGFTLDQRPPGPTGADVVLSLGDAPRGVTPVVDGDGRSLSLERGRQVVLRYWGLVATDARGRALPARIVVGGRRVALRVDDRTARYPVRVDPFVQAGKLTASDGAGGDELGWSTAISGDTIVVGAPFATVAGHSQQGAAYVFVKSAGGWADATQAAKLTASDGGSGDRLGYSVGISGDAIVLGAPNASVSGHVNRGAAYVFVKPAGGWADASQSGKLTASDGSAVDEFGLSVAASGDTIVVGADNAGQASQGEAYVYVRPPGGWGDAVETARLTSSDGAQGDSFGRAVAIDGDIVVAGAFDATVAGQQFAGAAYVFVKPAGGWANASETAKLTASDPAFAAHLGLAVAVSGDTVAAGAPQSPIAGNAPPGVVYVYVKPGNGWASGTETAKLTASDNAASNYLGFSVGVSGDTIAAGAPASEFGQPPSGKGALYVFAKPANGWVSGTETTKLSSSDNVENDNFGSSVGIDGGTIAAGSPQATVSGNASQGAAYVFAGGNPTSTVVSCAPTSVIAGQATTCTATVSDAGNGAPTTPTGHVSFSSDSHGGFSRPGASCTLSQARLGQASCDVDYSPSAVDSGAHRITATYAGDAAHTGSAGNTNVTVTAPAKRGTTTSVSCSPGSVTLGQASTCTATTTDSDVGAPSAPTGTVSFSSDSHGTLGSGGSCALAGNGAPVASCSVTYTPTAVDSRTHTITAAYPGDAAHIPSNGRGSVTVNPRPPIALPPPANTGPPINNHLPSISPAQSCVVFLSGRRSCQPIPYTYTCNPGQWTGNDPAVPYTYEWGESVLVRGSNNLLIQDFPTRATGQVFQYGPAFAGGSGIWRCRVTATAPDGTTAHADSSVKGQPLQGYLNINRGRNLRLFPSPVDIRVTGIEVTQGTQEAPCAGCRFVDPNHTPCATCSGGNSTLPSRDQVDPSQPGLARYSGVTMAAGKQAVVRVFASFTDPDASRGLTSLTGATAQLQVMDSAGHKLFCTPANPTCSIAPDFSPAALSLPNPACPLCVDLATRANPGSSFYFRIPAQETYHRSLSFHVTVAPQPGANQPSQCGGCQDNVFTLYNVPFKQPATVTIWPIPLTVYGLPVPPDRQQWLQPTFGDAQTVMPNPLQILPWDGTLAIEGLDKSHAVEAVDDRAEDNNLPSNIMPIGVYVPGAYPGLSVNTSQETGTLFDDGNPARAIVPYCTAVAPAPLVAGQANCRPLTAVAHEITHALAVGHADVPTRAPGDTTADCGGDSGGSGSAHFGEAWPPDYEGRIQGVGLDVRYWLPGVAGSLPNTWVEGFDHQGKSPPNNLGLIPPASGPPYGTYYYDYMSYCPPGGIVTEFGNPPEPLDWISPHNWERLVDFHAQNLPAAVDRRGRAADGTPLRVIAGVDSSGRASIFDVTPGRRSTHLPTPGSPYRLELRDASGNVLASAVPSTTLIHADGERPGVLLSGTLPMAADAASVVITAGGQELARRVRSAHAPTARFLSPRPGSRVGRSRITVVRFSARDADSDPLTAKVYYSPDRGRTWKVVAGPLTGTVARVPSRLLAGSRDGRLQVRISDGFNLTTVTSGRLRVAGSPPLVQIIGAPARVRVAQTAMLPLQGSAFDDAGRPLTGRHLMWYLGKRLIGSGDRAIARGLRPGNTTIRLIATDAHGRRAQATLPLRVTAVAARYLLFDAPLMISRRARSVRITVASTLPATFLIAGKRYALGPRERTLTIPVRAGQTLLQLPCSLRSPGGVIRGTYVAARGPR